jgi:hypothetical protein
VITLDGDGQHDPNDAPALLHAWHNNPNRLVVGSRLDDKAQFPLALPRQPFACFWISWAAGCPIADSSRLSRLPSGRFHRRVGDKVRSNRFTFEARSYRAPCPRHPSAGGRNPRALPPQRQAEPFPSGARHYQDRADGSHAVAEKGAPSHGTLA